MAKSVEQRNAYASALSEMTGRDHGQDWKAWRRYAEANDLPDVKLRD